MFQVDKDWGVEVNLRRFYSVRECQKTGFNFHLWYMYTAVESKYGILIRFAEFVFDGVKNEFCITVKLKSECLNLYNSFKR